MSDGQLVAGADSLLLFLVIAAIAAVSNWLQRRAQSQQEHAERTDRPKTSATPPPTRPTTRPVTPPPTVESTLERELRRLLGEEPPRPVPSPPPRPAPAPVLQPPPVIIRSPESTGRRSVPRQPVLPKPEVVATATATAVQLGQFGSGHGHAQHLHDVVALRPRRGDEHGPGRMHNAAQVLSSERAPSLAALSHDPQAVRQAFIASLIFGEPKGL